MEVLKTFRHEFKYIMPYAETLKLREELDKILKLDRNGAYKVKSLYFDTADNNDYYAKQNGELTRKKIRLRIYDEDSDYAKMEIKGKYDIHQLKESLVISKVDAQKIINGDYECL